MKRSISFKVTLILVFCLIIMMFLFGFYSYMYEKDQSTERLNTEIILITERLTFNLVTPLWDVYLLLVERTIEQEMNNKVIVAIIIKDEYGNYLVGKYRDENEKIKDVTKDPDILENITNMSFRKESSEIIKEEINKSLGMVEIYFTNQYLKQSVNRIFFRYIFETIFLAILILIMVLFSIRKIILNPLIKLDQFVKKFSQKDFDTRISIQSQDEIGHIGNSFNEMADTIQKYSDDRERLQSYLNNIIESMPSLLISLDNQARVVRWNTAATTILGISETIAIGKVFWKLYPSFSKYEKYFAETLQTQTPTILPREIINIGDIHYYNISIFPLESKDNQGVVFRFDDITEIIKKDEQLRQSQKMETVGTMAGGLAHDFNNILGGILGTTSLLMYKFKAKEKLDTDKLLNFIQLINESANRASNIVEQLMVISRKKEINFHKIDLNVELERVVKICSNTFDRIVTIKPVYLSEPAFTNADPSQIEQVLLNITMNAYHSMTIMKNKDQQGGELILSIEKVSTDQFFCSQHPGAELNTDYYTISIRDTGVGMDRNTIAKIFDPFFTTKKENKGTGLGLAMVYNIIQQHNGFVNVYSELGLGTTFHIYFKSESQESLTEKSQKDEKEIYKGEGTILVVDDEPPMRIIAKNILEECGYTVLLANNGQEGIDIYKKNMDKIKGVILDLIMPIKSGRDAFIEIKKMNPNAKVILVSGFKQDQRVTELKELGIDDFIQKPFTINKLSKAVYHMIYHEN
ncbi:MAG: response regulator [Spirochaetes bacterium]|nr:response regulator [Spirochaetota bacterium]